MKKFIFLLVFVVFVCLQSAYAQAYNPEYKNYVGTTTMRVPNGWYYGDVDHGYPSGKGYAFFKDSKLGWIIYKGDFRKGVFSGTGDVLCDAGFISGHWDNHKLISRRELSNQYVQDVCNDMRDIFQHKIQSKYLDLAEVVLPGGQSTFVEQISDDTRLGRKFMNKFFK